MAHTLPLTGVVASAAESKDSLVGTKLNGFVITGTVSVGGMGVVYEARHPIIGRRAAVKVIRPELCNDVGLSARFLREARAVSAVKHRNVVEILDFGALPDGAQYMMMEFLEGDTLAQVIARDAPMQPSEALRISEEILAGLSAAHQVGVVHRDLKPANIVLLKQSNGELIVKVLDFGLARHLDTTPEPTTRESLREMSLEKSSLLAGTPEYISPEQASGEQVGAQGDLYCLGVILYEMLSGRLPFNSTSPWELMQQHRLVKPPPLKVITPGIDPQLDDFVMRMLRKDPAERPLGAKEAAREVGQLRGFLSNTRLADTVVVDRLGETGFGPKPFWRKRPFALAAGATALIAIGLVFGAASTPEAAAVVRAPAPEVAMTPPPPPPAWEPPVAAPSRATPVATTMSAKPKPRVLVAASASCESNASWKRATREQLEDLEKLSLAKMKDDAAPSEVAKIKLKARSIATSVRNASGNQCQQVEAELRAWRTALR
jgi:tRNA A-37 threonylcarbamoyl transferase component Bud32